MLCLCIIRDSCCSLSGSTILNYIYHLCALDVVALGIDDSIVQTVENATQVVISELLAKI
jgi:hypothetical protein